MIDKAQDETERLIAEVGDKFAGISMDRQGFRLRHIDGSSLVVVTLGETGAWDACAITYWAIRNPVRTNGPTDPYCNVFLDEEADQWKFIGVGANCDAECFKLAK